jgi:molybdopterin/thiamine biosynthesis adenylyltransferase
MIRLKEYLQLYFSNEYIVLYINPYEKIEISKTRLTTYLIQKLLSPIDEVDLINSTVNQKGFNRDECCEIIEGLKDQGAIETIEDINSSEYERYKRQLLYFDILNSKITTDKNVYTVQNVLMKSHVVVHGTGGIGNYVSLSLIASGIGKITLIDNDIIELSNLNRQILFTEDDIGKPKIEIAKKRLSDLNSTAQINTIHSFASNETEIEHLYNQIGEFDFVILSADSNWSLKNWIDNYRFKVNFNYGIIPCGYNGDIGLVGPLVDNSSKRYSELFPMEDYIETELEKEIIFKQKKLFHPPSTTFLNAIISNIAALETIKYLSKFDYSTLYNKRLYLDSNNYNITIENIR